MTAVRDEALALLERLRPQLPDDAIAEADAFAGDREWSLVVMVLLSAGADTKTLSASDVEAGLRVVDAGELHKLTEHYRSLLNAYSPPR